MLLVLAGALAVRKLKLEAKEKTEKEKVAEGIK